MLVCSSSFISLRYHINAVTNATAVSVNTLARRRCLHSTQIPPHVCIRVAAASPDAAWVQAKVDLCRGVSFDQHCNIEKRVQNSNVQGNRPEVEVVSISGPEEFASMATAKAQERTDSLPQRTARGDLGKAIWLDCDPGHDDASKYES